MLTREPAAEWVAIDALRPWKDNPRKNDGEPVRKVAESIQRFGFGAPILARRENGEIIAGHTRWKAAKKLSDGIGKVATLARRLAPLTGALMLSRQLRLAAIRHLPVGSSSAHVQPNTVRWQTDSPHSTASRLNLSRPRRFKGIWPNWTASSRDNLRRRFLATRRFRKWPIRR